MKGIRTIFLVLLLIAGIENSYAQTADGIIEKYIKAIGGRENLSKIKSSFVVTEGRVMGMKVITKTTILYGKGMRMENETRGRRNITVYTEKSGWTTSDKNDSQTEQMPDDQYQLGREQIYLCNPFLDYKERGYKISYEGIEKVRRNDLIKIKMISPAGNESEYYFDPDTFYLAKAIQMFNMNGRDFRMETYYSNYRDTGTGYITPFTVESVFGGLMSVTSEIKEAVNNQPVNESIFARP